MGFNLTHSNKLLTKASYGSASPPLSLFLPAGWYFLLSVWYTGERGTSVEELPTSAWPTATSARLSWLMSEENGPSPLSQCHPLGRCSRSASEWASVPSGPLLQVLLQFLSWFPLWWTVNQIQTFSSPEKLLVMVFITGRKQLEHQYFPKLPETTSQTITYTQILVWGLLVLESNLRQEVWLLDKEISVPLRKMEGLISHHSSLWVFTIAYLLVLLS